MGYAINPFTGQLALAGGGGGGGNATVPTDAPIQPPADFVHFFLDFTLSEYISFNSTTLTRFAPTGIFVGNRLYCISEGLTTTILLGDLTSFTVEAFNDLVNAISSVYNGSSGHLSLSGMPFSPPLDVPEAIASSEWVILSIPAGIVTVLELRGASAGSLVIRAHSGLSLAGSTVTGSGENLSFNIGTSDSPTTVQFSWKLYNLLAAHGASVDPAFLGTAKDAPPWEPGGDGGFSFSLPAVTFPHLVVEMGIFSKTDDVGDIAVNGGNPAHNASLQILLDIDWSYAIAA